MFGASGCVMIRKHPHEVSSDHDGRRSFHEADYKVVDDSRTGLADADIHLQRYYWVVAGRSAVGLAEERAVTEHHYFQIQCE